LHPTSRDLRKAPQGQQIDQLSTSAFMTKHLNYLHKQNLRFLARIKHSSGPASLQMVVELRTKVYKTGLAGEAGPQSPPVLPKTAKNRKKRSVFYSKLKSSKFYGRKPVSQIPKFDE
jgi:hypothetical protein